MAKTQDKATGEATNLPAPTELFGTSIPVEFEEQYRDQSGAGTSAAAEDNVIPLLILLQDMSPEAKKRDPKYIEGAEPGDLLNKATRRLWHIDQECIVIPCAFQQLIMEWVPRSAGGGLVGRHDLNGLKPLDRLAQLGQQRKDEEDRLRWLSPSGNELIHTRYHYVVTLADGSYEVAVLPFSSTGHTSSKQWMTLLRKPKPGSNWVPPSWLRAYTARRFVKSNNINSWYGLEMMEKGWVQNRGLLEYCEAFHRAVEQQDVRAAEDAPTAAAGDPGQEIPF